MYPLRITRNFELNPLEDGGTRIECFDVVDVPGEGLTDRDLVLTHEQLIQLHHLVCNRVSEVYLTPTKEEDQ